MPKQRKLVKILNPIYDVAFKYLMEDKDIATLFLSDLIGEQIIDLEFRPKENVSQVSLPDGRQLEIKLYRLDFKAKIKLKDGSSKIVLIEIQKSFTKIDLFKFRKYLGEQYKDIDNFIIEPTEIRALPLLTIYFLGYNLKDLEEFPILRIRRKYEDFLTGKYINKINEFVENLTHDLIVIQLPSLKKKGRPKREIEKVLKVFEPGVNKYYLWVDEDKFPEKYKNFLKRLKMGAADTKIVNQMEFEDEVALAFRLLIQEERLRSKKLLEKERKERQKVIEKLLESAKLMKSLGMPIDKIAEATGLSKQEIEKL